MVEKIKKYIFIILLSFFILFFYAPILVQKIPIPADTIVGLYHPYRDLYASAYPNGIPFKNFLITDPVRQIYVWKELAIDELKSFHLPLWNPYEMSGKPLLGNFQSSSFYPLNIFFFLLPFPIAWTILIVSQSILSAIFIFYYLKNLKLGDRAAFFGGISFAFSGFVISWLEWGSIVSTILWLPLILLSIDRLIKKWEIRWAVILTVSGVCAVFAGHLQTLFYVTLCGISYFIFRRGFVKGKSYAVIFLCTLVVIVLTAIQTIPTIRFILLSNRSQDQLWTNPGWFVPFQNLIQFVSPDFFGNPATLNYFGVWNYAEFVGYIGIGPLILALYSIIKRRDRITTFFTVLLMLAIFFMTQNPVSQLIYSLNIPFLSSAQPTRLIAIVDISLAILAALGFDYFLKNKAKIWIPLLFIGFTIISLWGVVFYGHVFASDTTRLVARNNLIFPSVIFALLAFLLMSIRFISNRNMQYALSIIFLVICFFDVLRFGQKFTPFTNPDYLYPPTKIISYLQMQPGVFRVAALDNGIMPPNFFTHYRIQSIEGYDPLYLKNYSEFIVASERGKDDISLPFGFNRIITPHNFNSQLFDLLNTKYILTLTDIVSPKLTKIMSEGITNLYLNKNAFERVYFVSKVLSTKNDIRALFENDLKTTAIVSENISQVPELSVGKANISVYSPNEVDIKTSNDGAGFLVVADVYYPTWSAYVDGVKTKIYITDHAFRGVFVPSGIHTIIFKDNLF